MGTISNNFGSNWNWNNQWNNNNSTSGNDGSNTGSGSWPGPGDSFQRSSNWGGGNWGGDWSGTPGGQQSGPPNGSPWGGEQQSGPPNSPPGGPSGSPGGQSGPPNSPPAGQSGTPGTTGGSSGVTNVSGSAVFGGGPGIANLTNKTSQPMQIAFQENAVPTAANAPGQTSGLGSFDAPQIVTVPGDSTMQVTLPGTWPGRVYKWTGSTANPGTLDEVNYAQSTNQIWYNQSIFAYGFTTPNTIIGTGGKLEGTSGGTPNSSQAYTDTNDNQAVSVGSFNGGLNFSFY